MKHNIKISDVTYVAYLLTFLAKLFVNLISCELQFTVQFEINQLIPRAKIHWVLIVY